MLMINPTEFTTALTNNEAVSIQVWSSALTGLSTTLATFGAVYLLSSF